MKKITILFILIIPLIFSCSQNQGHIGPIFGKWQLKEIQTDDNFLFFDSIFYNFQNEYVLLQKLHTVPHLVESNMGFFVHSDDELKLELRDCTISRVNIYQLPDTIIDFKILQLNNKKMVLRLNDDKTYFFRKTGSI